MVLGQEQWFLMVWVVCSGCAIALLCSGSVAAIPEALAAILVPYLVFRRAGEPPSERKTVLRRPIPCRALTRERPSPNRRPTSIGRRA